MEKPKKAGRPAGGRFGFARTFKFAEADRADLMSLAESWRCTEAEAIRRAIREAAARERRK